MVVTLGGDCPGVVVQVVIHTQPKLVGMTKKKLVQMVSHWTSVILVMLARLAY